MTSDNHSVSAASSEAHSSRVTGRQRICRGLSIFFACGALLTAGCGILGGYGLTGPGFAGVSLLICAALATLSLISLVWVLVRRSYRCIWCAATLAVLTSWVSVFVAVYLISWLPHQTLQDEAFLESATPDEIRTLCHRSLILPAAPHDTFITLIKYGDESSVLYLIWALRFGPHSDDGIMECTWAHGHEALSASPACNK